jgi:serum/glucocorticoid-regulated kinase 2
MLSNRCRVLESIDHPFIVSLEYAFQTEKKLYLALEYAYGGDIFQHLAAVEYFPEYRAQFYAAEILLALEFLHSKNIIYRDLKPENVLIDAKGHIKLTDFGLAKELEISEARRTKTFCGTNEYLAPEVILGELYGESVDWWALGIVIYEMLTGWPPWTDDNRETLFKRILTEPLPINERLSATAIDLLKKMLVKRIKDRIKPANIKKHPFFASINFEKLLAKNVEPPFVPTLVY